MDEASLRRMEQLASQFHEATDMQQRQTAEAALNVLQTSPEYIPQCQFVLEHSRNSYAQLIASSSLLRLVYHHWSAFDGQLSLDLRNFLLNHIANNGHQLVDYVMTSLIRLVCRITKQGWLGNPGLRELPELANSFLQAGGDHPVIGLRMLDQLVLEMNTAAPTATVTQHRKIAVNFRDHGLFQIFQTALKVLQQVPTDRSASDQTLIKEHGISVALKCLSFDFIGTCPDETHEDLGSVQIPPAWRSAIEDTVTMDLFFYVYKTTEPPASSKAMECLVQMASVRGSIFSDKPEKDKYLQRLISGIRDILRGQVGLDRLENHHEFCRLLARIKTNYQLTHIVNTDGYQEWISLVCEFTTKTFRSWKWAPSSVYYLLTLWSRLVAAMTYLKGNTPSLLKECTPQVVQTYMMSRLESVRVALQDPSMEDPLADEDIVHDQLTQLPNIGRCSYHDTTKTIVEAFDPLARQYESFQKQSSVGNIEMQVVEGQLAWLVYIIGSIIGGRLNHVSTPKETDELDAELVVRVFQLMRIHDARLPMLAEGDGSAGESAGMKHIEYALLQFLQSFLKVVIGEKAMTSSCVHVYKKLQEMFGLTDHIKVLELMVQKIGTNLKYWARQNEVVDQTLGLFMQAAQGYSSNKLMGKLEITSHLLCHHTSEFFPFLDIPDNTRLRTTFYTILGRLLFGNDGSKFDSFVAPFEPVMGQLMSVTSEQEFRHPRVKAALIGLLRDLRGIVSSCKDKRSYSNLFEWIFPKYTDILVRAGKVYFDDPEVSSPLLTFMAEFVNNKQDRLRFNISSPNGILLFRLTSDVLVAYGTRILNFTPRYDLYSEKLKGIHQLFTALAHAISGEYVNFGVFALYGDPALSNVLNVAIKLALIVPRQDLMAYPKITAAYFGLLLKLASDHIRYVVELDTSTFLHILSTIEDGITSIEQTTSSRCCTSLNSFAEFLYKNKNKTTPSALVRYFDIEDGVVPDDMCARYGA
eukprot:TRINITY_DN3954_c0_g1_i3.p1 TRINITY_DN3954_c0_g1~~TRINITY_DN3954_c0_g1_i3.p1  ORF type:complete len:978 (+),score=185.05 TRINITY_DN3954_c0_g1_i3:153-3086(+)